MTPEQSRALDRLEDASRLIANAIETLTSVNQESHARLPQGWRVEIEGDTALVVAPQNGPGGLVVAQHSGPLADRLLFALVKSLTE